MSVSSSSYFQFLFFYMQANQQKRSMNNLRSVLSYLHVSYFIKIAYAISAWEFCWVIENSKYCRRTLQIGINHTSVSLIFYHIYMIKMAQMDSSYILICTHFIPWNLLRLICRINTSCVQFSFFLRSF